MKMFCFQCEQTAKGTGCTVRGVCGKDPETAALQDLLNHAAKGISMYGHRARAMGASDRDIDVFIVEALFSTVTNVNFDVQRMQGLIAKASVFLGRAKELYQSACQKAGKEAEILNGPAAWTPAADLNGLVAKGNETGIEK